MSGGSYKHLCCKDPEELFEFTMQEEIGFMHLAILSYKCPGAEQAAASTISVLDTVKALQDLMTKELLKIKPELDKLRVVWKAVEYHNDNDMSEKDVHDALRNFDVPVNKVEVEVQHQPV